MEQICPNYFIRYEEGVYLASVCFNKNLRVGDQMTHENRTFVIEKIQWEPFLGKRMVLRLREVV